MLVLLSGGALPSFAGDRAQAQAVRKLAGDKGRAISADPSRDNIFPYMYDGAGWSSTFVFTNLDSRTVKIRLEFSADDGSDLLVPVLGVGKTSAVDITLGIGGTISLTTEDTAKTRTSAYAFAGAANGSDRFSGYEVVRQQTSGLPDLEFTIPLTPIDENQFVLPFDNTDGFATFVSLVNSSLQNSAIVNVTVQDQDGNVLTTDQISIQPLGRDTFDVAEQYPQLKKIVGSILFSARGQQFVTGMGLRSGPNDSLTAILPFSLR